MKSLTSTLLMVLVLLGTAKEAFSQLPSKITELIPAFIQLSDKVEPHSLASAFRLDFVVPDAPAFELLDSESSNILRPSSVKEFATSFSSFVDGSDGFSIPKSFAIEFSPGLLIGGNGLTLKTYQNNAWLYRFRLSAGTKRLEGESGPSQIAFGFRTSFIDEGDLRKDKELLKSLTDIASEMLHVVTDTTAGVGPPPVGARGAEEVQLTSEQQDTIDSLNTALKERIAKAQADQRWNKEALDVAGALLLGAQDSLGKNLRTAEIAGWFTYANGFGTWGQLLVGLKGGAARDSLGGDFSFSGSISTRLYVGTNSYKMFAEAQLEKQSGVESLLLNGGGEARLSNGVWVAFDGGIARDFDQKKWNAVTKFTIKVGLPFIT